jgi:NAD(P)-dependent dehydrogenase (short-subunit alcohol dehydrogenase family)
MVVLIFDNGCTSVFKALSRKKINQNKKMKKNILVVGGSKGIGLALVKNLIDMGYNVLSAARTATPELAAMGVQQLIFDATQPMNVDEFVLPDALHGLAYCPGSITLKPLQRLTNQDFINDYTINVLGAVQVIQHCTKSLRRAEGGANIVLFSTVAVGTGMAFHASIAAAKGAVEGLTRSLAAEFAPNKLRVNALAPSLTNTSLAGNLLSSPEKTEAADKRHPLGRVGQPQDVASLAAYLLSDQNTWITGQIIQIDGGMGSLK